MKRLPRTGWFAKSASLLALSALGIQLSLAEQVILESTIPSATSGGAPAPCPPFCVSGFSGTISTSKSSAPGTNPSRYGSRLGASGTPSFTVSPTLAAVGVYRIYVTHISGNASPNIVVNVTATDGDLSVVSTEMFRATNAINVWGEVGYLTNSTTTPTVTFTYASGTLAGTGGRFYADAVMFESLDPCTGVSPTLGTVGGPLVAGQTFVNVAGVATGATNVTVYADGAEIGSLTSGVVAGANTVTTTALVKGQLITATQTRNGCVSTRPLAGPPVGGGANPSLRVSLSLGQSAALAGPVGANSATPASVYMLKASGTSAGFASAPLGGYDLAPESCWRTLLFNADSHPGYVWNGAGTLPDTNNFAALEGLAICINNATPDSGPYDVYIDSIRNGDTLIEGFESYTNDAPNVFFTAPSAAAIPQPKLLSQPNSTQVSTNNADTGTNSLRLRWQFNTEDPTAWVHLLANGTGHTYPQIDLRKPVSISLLVLPAGQTNGTAFGGAAGTITNTSVSSYLTQTNTLGVSVTGPGSYTYQWTLDGAGLPNAADGPTYTIDGGGSGLSLADNGLYTVQISDGSCTVIRGYNLVVKEPIPTITNQPAHAIINAGTTVAVMRVGADGHVTAGYPLTYLWRSNGVDITDQTLDTLWITNASLADVLAYDVVVGNSYGSVTSSIAYVDVVPVGITAGNGTGLRGDYRTAHFATNAFTGTPTLSRTDATVDFDWLTGSPDPAVSADNFTARWTGQVQALGTDDYTFHTISDDGVRLWVNGQLLVDQWIDHSPWTNSGNLTLTGTSKYDLTLEFYEKTGGAVSKLYWSSASGSVGFEPVPQSQLYPAPAGPLLPIVSHSQPDASHITFNWGVGTYNLAWATNILGPYTNIIYGVTSPHTETIGSEPQKYFRLLVQ